MKVSYSNQTVIKEICKVYKEYKAIGVLKCSLIFNKFKNDPEGIVEEFEFSNYEAAILDLNNFYVANCNLLDYYGVSYNSKYCLSEHGKDLVRIIKARKQTRYLLAKNCDLFPENANLIL